jgi:hypothetical protein
MPAELEQAQQMSEKIAEASEAEAVATSGAAPATAYTGPNRR